VVYYLYGPLSPRPAHGYNVIMISVDGLRPDHLGCYGYNRLTSPEIDRLAGRGAVFKRAYAQTSWTLPSSVSFLTSLYPSTHGVNLTSLPQRKTLEYMLRVNAFTLFSGAGYSVRGLLNAWYGVGPLDKVYSEIDNASGGAAVMNRKARFFIRRNRRRPFFLILHYMDVHSPYVPRRGYIEQFANPAPTKPWIFVKHVNTGQRTIKRSELKDIINIYDSNILFLDDHVRDLTRLLDNLGLGDRTIVVITSDHGEAFMEHGYLSHSLKLYEEFIRIPLIVVVPGLTDTGAGVEAPVQSVDLLPTLVDLLHLGSVERMQGKSLLPLMEGGTPPDLIDRDVFAELTLDSFYYFPPLVKAWGGKTPGPECQYIAAVISWPWKYIHYLKTGRSELFNLESDPRERTDLSEEEPEIAGRMKQKLEAYWARNLAAGGVDFREELSLGEKEIFKRMLEVLLPMSTEVVDQLRSLGYIK
jgi:arylsulfatase A-like enzyme